MKVGGRLFWMTSFSVSAQGVTEFEPNFLRMDPSLGGPCLLRFLTMLHDDVLAIASPGPELVEAFDLPTHLYHRREAVRSSVGRVLSKTGKHDSKLASLRSKTIKSSKAHCTPTPPVRYYVPRGKTASGLVLRSRCQNNPKYAHGTFFEINEESACTTEFRM